MTKEQFQEEMLKRVIFHKEKLEQAELRRVLLPTQIQGGSKALTFNPFAEFDDIYFNIRLLSNIEALHTVMCQNPDVEVHQIKLFIISNPKFKVLNQVLNNNIYMVEELKDNIHSPMDIAIAYARHCEMQDKYKNIPKR